MRPDVACDRRVALLTLAPPATAVGGVETFTTSLQRALGAVDVIALDEQDGGIAFLKAARLLGLSEPARALMVARKFLRLHRRERYACAICNGMTAWLFAIRRLSIPVVCVFHGNYAGYVRAVTAPRSFARFRGLLWSQFERLAAFAADKVVAVSPSVENEVRTYYGRPSVTIPNSPDEGTFRPGPAAAAREALALDHCGDVALFVGRPTHAKGFDVVEALAAALPGTLFVCAVTDDVPVARPNIRLYRRPSPATLRLLYQAASYVVAPSRFEGCSYVPLEALACGTPVITSPSGLFRCGSDVDGVHVVRDGADPAAYVEVIERLDDAGRPAATLPDALRFAAFRHAYLGLVNEVTRSQIAMEATPCGI